MRFLQFFLRITTFFILARRGALLFAIAQKVTKKTMIFLFFCHQTPIIRTLDMYNIIITQRKSLHFLLHSFLYHLSFLITLSLSTIFLCVCHILNPFIAKRGLRFCSPLFVFYDFIFSFFVCPRRAGITFCTSLLRFPKFIAAWSAYEF